MNVGRLALSMGSMMSVSRSMEVLMCGSIVQIYLTISIYHVLLTTKYCAFMLALVQMSKLSTKYVPLTDVLKSPMKVLSVT